MDIRRATPEDSDAIVALSLRAWASVFDSARSVLGDGLFFRFWPSWEDEQAKAVRDAIETNETWVSDDGSVTGFVNVKFDTEGKSGEIYMIAVDPDSQGGGHGRRLTDFATDEMRLRGMTVATVQTGGDPGHGPARATYEAAGFTAFPQVYYSKLLDPPDSAR